MKNNRLSVRFLELYAQILHFFNFLSEKNLKKLIQIKQNVDNTQVTGFSYVELTLSLGLTQKV